MDRNDRQAIEGLFQKLSDVERQSPQRDAESEAFIKQMTGRQPAAPYYMAQTIVVQEQALNAAQARIEELEQAPQPSSGGLLGSLFGGGQPSRPRGSVPRTGSGQGYAQSGWQNQQGGGGGGFLAGAAQTAMGVAGGVLLGNAIGGLFGADEAHAGTQDNNDDGQDSADDGAAADAGGDMGDMGDTDF